MHDTLIPLLLISAVEGRIPMNLVSPITGSNELLQLLAHQYRRQTFQFLDGQPDNTATMDELVGYIDSVADEVSLRTELFHVHLPKLNESNLIDWDSQSEMIRYYPNDLCEELLYVLETHTS
ncbi:DUF7344 domain-containing protein [Natronorubrum thiooxidans]|uniref:DUF7344 domain-containing protein n=1 Tax=Natronorubrum thiooxidans TaxID=308853 RepID=A0A1N7GZG0_9EURY|nr:hypothetical protein SAMN05421752_11837 [Natronorubrum thiooxidans]